MYLHTSYRQIFEHIIIFNYRLWLFSSFWLRWLWRSKVRDGHWQWRFSRHTFDTNKPGYPYLYETAITSWYCIFTLRTDFWIPLEHQTSILCGAEGSNSRVILSYAAGSITISEPHRYPDASHCQLQYVSSETSSGPTPLYVYIGTCGQLLSMNLRYVRSSPGRESKVELIDDAVVWSHFAPTHLTLHFLLLSLSMHIPINDRHNEILQNRIHPMFIGRSTGTACSR